MGSLYQEFQNIISIASRNKFGKRRKPATRSAILQINYTAKSPTKKRKSREVNDFHTEARKTQKLQHKNKEVPKVFQQKIHHSNLIDDLKSVIQDREEEIARLNSLLSKLYPMKILFQMDLQLDIISKSPPLERNVKPLLNLIEEYQNTINNLIDHQNGNEIAVKLLVEMCDWFCLNCREIYYVDTNGMNFTSCLSKLKAIWTNVLTNTASPQTSNNENVRTKLPSKDSIVESMRRWNASLTQELPSILANNQDVMFDLDNERKIENK